MFKRDAICRQQGCRQNGPKPREPAVTMEMADVSMDMMLREFEVNHSLFQEIISRLWAEMHRLSDLKDYYAKNILQTDPDLLASLPLLDAGF